MSTSDDSTPRPWVCKTCGKQYQHNTHLRRHEANHVNPNQYPCPICKKEFSRRDVCKKHVTYCIEKSNLKSSKNATPLSKKLTKDTSSGQKMGTADSYVLSDPLASMPLIREMLNSSFVLVMKANNNIGANNEDVPDVDEDNQLVYPSRPDLPSFDYLASLFSIKHANLIDALVGDEFGADLDFDMISLSGPSPAPIFTDAGFRVLETASALLVPELEMFHEQLLATQDVYHGKFDVEEAKVIFSAESLRAYLAVFFRQSLGHVPIIHYPTFGTEETSRYLIIVLAITSSYQATPIKHALAVRRYSGLVYLFIYRKLRHAISTSPEGIPPSPEALQLIQGIICLLYGMLIDVGIEAKKDARSEGLPLAISALRHFGLMEIRYSHGLDWFNFIYNETCIRSVNWMSLLIWYHSVMHNYSNHVAISEVVCNIPCPSELWNALDSTTYILAREKLKTSNSPAIVRATRSVKDVISNLMDDEWVQIESPSLDVLPADIFYIVGFALCAIFVSAHQMKTIKGLSESLLRAAKRWKVMFNGSMSLLDVDTREKLGLPRYSGELTLLMETLIGAHESHPTHAYFTDTGHLSSNVLFDLLLKLSMKRA